MDLEGGRAQGGRYLVGVRSASRSLESMVYLQMAERRKPSFARCLETEVLPSPELCLQPVSATPWRNMADGLCSRG
jgi:hypothetical protein